MYAFSEMEAGEKSNRSLTYANPCLCCCPTIEISTLVTCAFDIAIHLYLIVRTMTRMFGLRAEENVLFSFVAAMIVLVICLDILLIMGITNIFDLKVQSWSKLKFRIVVKMWIAAHIILLFAWFAVTYYTVRPLAFGRRPFRKFVPHTLVDLIDWYALLELFAIFLIYLWFIYILIAFGFFTKHTKVYMIKDRYDESSSSSSSSSSDEGESNRPPC